MTEVTLYTDGSARGNPNGPGGYGAILSVVDRDGVDHRKELSQGYVKTTNNRMELMAVIAGLEALTRPCLVHVYSDSSYVVKAFTEHWLENWKAHNWKTAGKKPVKNRDLWERLDQQVQIHDLRWHWVKGHAGNPGNERCDELATTAADSDALIEDTGLETEEE